MCRRYDFFIQPMQSTIQDPEALHKHPLITPEWVGHSSFTGLWKVCPSLGKNVVVDLLEE